jgi:DNA invertase Pin-like site-specific DNA recombinase
VRRTEIGESVRLFDCRPHRAGDHHGVHRQGRHAGGHQDRSAGAIDPGDLQDIVRVLRTKGAALKATEQPIDTTTAAGKAFLDMLGVFAEFETNLRRERQMEGIAKAKAAGVYKGRPPSIDGAQVLAMRKQGIGPAAIARKLGISRQSVYHLRWYGRGSGSTTRPKVPACAGRERGTY